MHSLSTCFFQPLFCISWLFLCLTCLLLCRLMYVLKLVFCGFRYKDDLWYKSEAHPGIPDVHCRHLHNYSTANGTAVVNSQGSFPCKLIHKYSETSRTLFWFILVAKPSKQALLKQKYSYLVPPCTSQKWQESILIARFSKWPPTPY